MRAKLITLTLVLAVVGAASLMMRHQRLHWTARVTDEFRASQVAARQLWHAQARAAHLLRPDALRERIDRARLAVVPTPRQPNPAADHVRFVLLPDAESLER